MAIHFISGKPRGGKSLYAVKLCIEELVFGERVVITNLSFKLPELNAYLQQKYPAKSIDLHERLRVLTDEETNKFWLIRPGNPVITLLTDAQWKAGLKPDYSQVTDKGVLYAIDEIHNFFNARAWIFKVKKGQLVIFPSYLTHSVQQSISDQKRISLAFNTFFKGTIGEAYSFSELKI